MMEKLKNTVESQEQEPGFNEKLNNLFQEALEKIKGMESPSRGALVGLFLLASAQEAEADNSENVQSFFDANYQTFSEQIYTPELREALRLSPDVGSFMDMINTGYENASDKEKLSFMADLGGQLGNQYNYDMLENSEYVAISSEDMYQALRNGRQTGICGNIHTFMAEAAKNMGMEAWTQVGVKNENEDAGNHAFMGTVINNDGKEEIVWVDYNQVIQTGTDDYSEALGVYEYNNSIAIFPSSTDGTPQSLVQSHTQETIADLIGQDGIEAQTEFVPSGIDYSISEEMTEVTIKAGMAYLRFGEFSNSNTSEHEPLSEATYVGAGINGNVIDTEHLTFELQAEVGKLTTTSAHARFGEVEAEHLIGQLSYSGELTGYNKQEWGELTHKLYAMGNMQDSLNLEDVNNMTMSGGHNKHRVGYTVIFDPTSSDASFFVTTETDFTHGGSDMQNYDQEVIITAQSLSAGATIGAYEGSFKVTDGMLADSFSISGSYTDGDRAHSISAERSIGNQDIPGRVADTTSINYSYDHNQFGVQAGLFKEDGGATSARIGFSISN